MTKHEVDTSALSFDITWITLLSIVMFSIIIANPGYFNHDELQKLDHVRRYGLIDYWAKYVTVAPTQHFGTPVRPFSFFIQGVLALLMENYPVFVHMIDVLTHAAVAVLLYRLSIQFGCTKTLARSIAFVFIINPLAMLATGWTAALMDRWYLLFGLLALSSAERFILGRKNNIALMMVFIWASLAILSKETAVVLPGLMLIIFIAEPNTIKCRRYWIATVVWCAPILLFMIYRLPALLASFGNPQVTAYNASISNIPEGVLVYLSYPFLPFLNEAVNWVFIPTSLVYVAAGAHVLLSLCLVRIAGYKTIIFYWFFYFLFIFPVLIIPNKSAHYLYGSSLVLSVATAFLLHQSWDRRFICKAVGVVSFSILSLHSIMLQLYVYSIGACMNRVLISTEAAYLANGRPYAIDFQAEPGSLDYILYRTYTGREQIGDHYPVKLTVSKWGERNRPDSLSLVMDKQCLVYPKIDK